MDDVVNSLNKISEPPAEEESYTKWLEMNDALTFLRENCRDDEFVVYANNRTSFIHAVLVPADLVSPPDYEDLSNWNCNPSSCWGVDLRFSEPQDVWITPPLDHTGSRTLDAGEQLVFHRTFEGFHGKKKTYIELLQKFTHVCDVHFVEERQAFCRLDQYGDLVDMIRIVEIPGKGDDFGASTVVINRSLLDEYLVLSRSVVVRMFDFTRYRTGQFSGWRDRQFSEYEEHGDLCYRAHLEPGYASFLRGFHLVHPAITKDDVRRRHDYTLREADREYASFIAWDFKNKVLRAISTAPGATANYFTKSDLPFETSPAFFRPEVLLRYKFDSEKYTLQSRSISCRGGWSLPTFDVNDAGQVHTYIVYLRRLPYEEQLHWKAHNEEPKAPISRRAFTTDFEGDWYLEYDALSSLQEILHQWYSSNVPWWTLRTEKLIDLVHYPVTASHDEWSDELLRLDQLVVEGFEKKWLRSRAEGLGRKPDVNFGSLKLIEECLLGLGFEPADAATVAAPFKDVRELRSKMKGHASGGEAATIRKKVLKEYGTFRSHFQALCKRCDESIRTVTTAFSS